MSNQPGVISFKKILQFEGKVLTVNEGTGFDVKRIYWINYSADQPTQSEHAHKTLEQILIAVSGEVQVTLEDMNGHTETFILNDPSTGLYIPPLHWKRISYRKQSILLCLASDEYNEADYIRDYTTFKQLSKT